MSESIRRIAGTARDEALELGPAPRSDAPAAAEPEHISRRLQVPKADFHESEHAALHNGMGAAFDRPEAAGFVRDAYRLLRRNHPDIHPSHVLATVRDAFHAADYNLMPPAMAVAAMHLVARRRHKGIGP
jgi:hypothetical protein